MSAHRCPVCTGKGANLGSFGNAIAYRCRDCGWNWVENKFIQRDQVKPAALPAGHARMYPGRRR